MNQTLNDILNNAEAVKATNNALIDSFKYYVHKLIESELDYEYVQVDEFRKALKLNCWRMAIYEARLNGLSNEENFNNFCRYIYLQAEALISFTTKNKFSAIQEFEAGFHQFQLDRIKKFLLIDDFSLFKNEYEQINKDNPEAKVEDSEKSKKQLQEFQVKHQSKIELMLDNISEFSIFLKKEQRDSIKSKFDFTELINIVYKKMDKQYKSLDRVPFGYKFELFAFYNELSKATKETFNVLSEYRNKRLSHAITNTVFLSKSAEQFEANKNFGAIKDALIEVNNLVKSNLIN